MTSKPFLELTVPGILNKHDLKDGLWLLSPLLFVNADSANFRNCSDGCSDLRLKTYVMLLASTGLRGTEALSIRLKDIDLDSSSVHPSKITIRGEYTKTKVNRYIFLTKEVKEQLKIWLDYKYS